MATTVLYDGQFEMPLNLQSLADFRRWALSEEFPDRGRIDFVGGRIEVAMSPEDFFCHGTLKTELIVVLGQRVKQAGLGHLVTDRTRVSSPAANLSTEPDIVFVSNETLQQGRARLIPAATGQPGRYVELEGAPDLVVEIISDASVEKDTVRLPAAYYEAGVGEFWLADARSDELLFRIHHRGNRAFEPVPPDADGFQHSAVMRCHYRLDGTRDAQGHWTFNLQERA